MITLRPATEADAERLLIWRNHETTRAMFNQTHPIDEDMHERWLIDVLRDPNRHLYVAEQDGVPVGTVRFDVTGAEAEASVTVDPDLRGTGIGTEMLRLGTAKALLICSKVVARIKPENLASQKAFAKAGYTQWYRTETEVLFVAER